MSYSALMLQHFYHPHYAGALLSGPAVYLAQASIPSGDKVALSLLVAHQRIDDIRYQVYGCPAMIACMSWLATELVNKDYAQAMQFTPTQISQALSLPAHKYRCALLAAEVLQKALTAWYNSQQ